MADPLKYFPEAKQKALAQQVWTLAATKREFYSTICQANFYRFSTQDARRVVHAKDWLTYWRQDGAPDDNDSVNKQLNHLPGYYSGECIADVEHFFVAAFMHLVIGPSLTQVAIFGYETLDTTLKIPLMKAADAYNHGRDIGDAFFSGFPSGWAGWFNRAKWNYGQAIRAQAGIAFAAELLEGRGLVPGVDDNAVAMARALDAIRRGVEYLRRAIPPPAKLPKFDDAPPAVCPINPKPGVPDKEFILNFADPNRRSLSAIAKILYGHFDYWPLLFWHNSKIINPNRLKGLRSVRYREKNTYSPDDLRKAKEFAPSWKQFPM